MEKLDTSLLDSLGHTIAEELGITYRGMWETGKDKTPFMTFNHPCGTTFLARSFTEVTKRIDEINVQFNLGGKNARPYNMPN